MSQFIYDNVKDLRLGTKKVLRVMNKGELIYPKVIKDGLVLHYDFRGYTNNNVNRDVAYDLSGNNNHGVLKNFAFASGSGYDGQGLIFDGVDDFVQLPELGLDADDFTAMINDKIFSYRGEEVAQVMDGSVGVGGRNLLLNSNIFTTGWRIFGGVQVIRTPEQVVPEWEATDATKIETVGGSSVLKFYRQLRNPLVNDTRIVSFWVKNDSDSNLIITFNGGTVLSGSSPSALGSGFSGRVIYNIRYNSGHFQLQFKAKSAENSLNFTVWRVQVEKGTIATDWTPAPEDFTTVQKQQPIFDNEIKNLHYWNRALTDAEILQMYNFYKND